MSRRGWGLVVLAGIAAAVAVVVVLVAGDDGRGKTVRGEPARSLPLRGSLADDRDAIDGAVAAWRDQDASVVDDDDDVTVLWIGRAGAGDVAILTNVFHYAELTRADGGWIVRTVRPKDGYSDRGAPIGVGDSVLVPDAGRWRYVPVGGSAAPVAVDGLFRTPAGRGFVLTAQDAAPPGDVLDVYVTGVGRLTLIGDDLPRLLRILDGGQGDTLWHALREADAPLDRIPSPARYARQYVDLPWDGTMPDGRDGVVVALDRGGSVALAAGHVVEGTAAAGTLLGTGRGSLPNGVVVAGEVELSGVPCLVLAGVGAQTLTARVGPDRLSRRGPVAFVDARRWRAGGTLPKVTVSGRGEDGEPVASLR